MRTYEKYKDSGISWIGMIPDDWEIRRIKQDCSLHGRIGWNGLRSEEFEKQSYAYLVTGQDFRSSDVNWNACYQINEWRFKEDPFIQLKNGDILITKDGTIGKIAMVRNLDKPACLNSGIFVMRQKKKQYEQRYLYWSLCSNLLKDFNSYRSTGTTILHLYQNVFENMPLVCPSLYEQEAIANYLDKKTAEIDKIIAEREKKIELLNELKSSIISRAVTKGINPHAKMKDSGIDWIGEIPEGWEVRKAKTIFADNGILVGPFGSAIKLDDMVEGGYKVYGQENIISNNFQVGKRFLTKEKFLELKRFRLISGDILLTMMGTIGRCSITPKNIKEGIIDSHLMRIRLNQSVVTPEFFTTLYGNAMYIKNQLIQNSKGSIMNGLNSSIVKNLFLALPPKDEQIIINQFVKYTVNNIDVNISNINKELSLLREYKQSLISEVVTGKRKVID